MREEVWKQSYVDGYEVSNFGRVRNSVTKKIHSLEKEEKGYVRLSVRVNGKKKHFAVHRLVALAFIPNPNGYPQIDHINAIKSDNSVENLRWCNNQQNSKWRVEWKNYQYSILDLMTKASM